ncbi:MAG: hypothetical protein IJ629_03040 [Clostridia bacterium]|nr:hypothetical protein [Clostridia bacterium]
MEEKYKISYSGVEIGELKRKTEENKVKHHFVPAQKGLQVVEAKIRMFPELFEESNGWTEPIPLFENRILDAKRFGAGAHIVNQTDGFELELVETEN